MVGAGAARRRARRAARRHGRTAGAAACALWAALVIAAIVGSTAALWASGSQWVATRSSNALDELYYATVDERCYEVLAAGVDSDDAWRSALTPIKAPSPFLTERSNRIRSPWTQFLLNSFGFCGAAYTEYWKMATVAWFNCDTGKGTYVRCRASDEEVGRVLFIEVVVPLKSLNKSFEKDDYFDVELVYSQSKKKLFFRGEDSCTLDTSSTGRLYELDNIGKCLSKHDVTLRETVEEAVQIIRKKLLPAFLTRGGTESHFSADFEKDGVMLDFSPGPGEPW